MKAQIINDMFLIQGLFYIIEQEKLFEFYASEYQIIIPKNYFIRYGSCYVMLTNGLKFPIDTLIFLEECDEDIIADVEGRPDIYLTKFNFEKLKKFINYERQEEFSRRYRQSI